MTDLEITRACAEAMELPNLGDVLLTLGFLQSGSSATIACTYDPLHDDAQCMALVKRFLITLERATGIDLWYAQIFAKTSAEDADLNRAICLCVARITRGESK